MRLVLAFIAGIFLIGGLTPALDSKEGPQQKQLIRFTTVVDLTPDRGQDFGSLFEAKDSNGRVVAGAGFLDAYNTRFRSDRHVLQFFVRPEKQADRFTIDRLPHPDLDCGVYLFDLNQKLFAWSSVHNNSVRAWNETTQKWRDAPPPKSGGIRSGDGIMRVGSGRLVFTNNRVSYNGRSILEPPKAGRYYNFYYAQGRLFFYHTQGRKTDGFTKIYACSWTPNDRGKIDLTAATAMQTKYVGETPFTYGQFRGTVLNVSNQGGVYAFEGGRWRTLLEADNRVSFQMYSALNYYDRLLLAQYPTGFLFEYKGKGLKLLKGWPPRLHGVSPHAREAQTMAIYRGELFVGVWPWAELWRYEAGGGKWHSLGRMFTHPPLTDKKVHPYEAESKKYGLALNHWGQRVTSLVPFGDALILSTSSKGTSRWYPKYTFLTEKQRREYGAVLRLKMPGNLAAQIEWKDRPTKLDFLVHRDRIVVRQDGKQLGMSRIAVDRNRRFDRLKIDWGRGVFGKLNGRLVSKSVE